jgi:hypothetical protein
VSGAIEQPGESEIARRAGMRMRFGQCQGACIRKSSPIIKPLSADRREFSFGSR